MDTLTFPANKTSHASSARIQASRKFIGYALSYDPTNLYQCIDLPSPINLGIRTSNYIRTAGHEAGRLEYIPSSDEDVANLLENAVNDTRNILQSVITPNSLLLASDALAVIRHPATVQAFAHIALRHEGQLDDLIAARNNHPHIPLPSYHIDMTRGDIHLTASPFLPRVSAESGCPFAGRDGEIDIDPLFNNFIPWAGELAVRSIYNHK